MKKYNKVFAFIMLGLFVVSTAHAKTPDGLVDEDDKKGAAAAAPAEVLPVVEAEGAIPAVDIEGLIANERQAPVDAIPGGLDAGNDKEAGPDVGFRILRVNEWRDPAVEAIRAYHVRLIEEMRNADGE